MHPTYEGVLSCGWCRSCQAEAAIQKDKARWQRATGRLTDELRAALAKAAVGQKHWHWGGPCILCDLDEIEQMYRQGKFTEEEALLCLK